MNNQGDAGQAARQPDIQEGTTSLRRSTESPRARRIRRGTGKKQRRYPQQEKFEGMTEALKGHYYDMGYNRSEQFNKTTKAICNYTGTRFKNGADVRVSIEAMEVLNIPISDIQDNPTPLQRRIWEKEVDDLVKRRSILDQNLKSLFSLIWGKCTISMRAKVETMEDYSVMKTDSDSLKLIQALKDIVFNVVTQNKYKPQAMHEALRRFYLFKQEEYMPNSDYLEKYKTIVEVCQATGVEVGSFRSLGDDIMVTMGDDPDIANEEETNAALVLVTEHYQATAFLLSADRSRYGKMLEDIMNGFL